MSRKARLTSHQAEVFGRLERHSTPVVSLEHEDGTVEVLKRKWIDSRQIGSGGALDHIVAKGYAERREVRGPRGGYHYEYRPLTDAREVSA